MPELQELSKQQLKSNEEQTISENKEQINTTSTNESTIQNENNIPQINEEVLNQTVVNETNEIQNEPKKLTKEEEIMNSINQYLKRKGQN